MSSPSETDPIDASDPAELQREVLRARDAARGAQARGEVLEQRVAELEDELHALGAHADELQARLDRSPIDRGRRALRRLVQMVRPSR